MSKKQFTPWNQILLKYLIDSVKCNASANKIMTYVTLNKKNINIKNKKKKKFFYYYYLKKKKGGKGVTAHRETTPFGPDNPKCYNLNLTSTSLAWLILEGWLHNR
jgi:hypothetical protein